MTLKFNKWNSAIIIFQQTVGVSLFSLQKALQMVGIVWGGFLTFIGCYLTTYGLILLSNTAGEIEDELKMDKRLKNLDEMANYIDYKGIILCKWMMMICGVGIMFASTVTNIFIIGIFVLDSSELLRRNIWSKSAVNENNCIHNNEYNLSHYYRARENSKTHIFHKHCDCTYRLFLVLQTAFICLLHNLYLFITGQGVSPKEIPLVRFESTGTFCGNMAYAYELAAAYLSRIKNILTIVRLMANVNVQYNKVTLYMLSFIGVNYFACAASYLLVLLFQVGIQGRGYKRERIRDIHEPRIGS